MKGETKIVVSGRNPKDHAGAVNTPVYHASTIIYPSLAAIRGTEKIPYTYGRRGTPTTSALQDAMNVLEGADGTMLTPSGASAVSLAIMTAVSAGAHLLMVDSAYQPTRKLCDQLLSDYGVETEYYDPLIGGDIANLIRDNTAMIFMESPGSQTFEVQDVPAIVAAAQKAGVKTAIDNTWATPLNFRPLDFGVDFSVLAATKYVVGHADALLGTVAAKGDNFTKLERVHGNIGFSVGPDDVFLALRGLRPRRGRRPVRASGRPRCRSRRGVRGPPPQTRRTQAATRRPPRPRPRPRPPSQPWRPTSPSRHGRAAARP